MRKTQLLGLLLWRGGVIAVGTLVFFEGARWFLRFFDIPVELQAGLGLVLAGLGFVVASLIAERIRDARAEGDLHQ